MNRAGIGQYAGTRTLTRLCESPMPLLGGGDSRTLGLPLAALELTLHGFTERAWDDNFFNENCGADVGNRYALDFLALVQRLGIDRCFGNSVVP